MADFEKIDMDMANAEVRLTRSDYAQVIFRNVAEKYTIDRDVDVLYTVTRYHSPSKRDWIGLYRVGWTSSSDQLYYHWAVIPQGYKAGEEYEAKVTFSGKVLPKDDDDFYQFCYVTSSGQVRGASTPFQFKNPSAEEFVEFVDSDNDMMVIKSRTNALQEQLRDVQNEKEDILKQKHRVEKEMESYVNKLMEIEKVLAAEKQEKDAVRVDLQATQDKVASLHTEVKEKTANYEILKAKLDKAEGENKRLESQLMEAEQKCEMLRADLRALQNEVDELAGKHRSLEKERDLYKEHFNTSSETLKENTLHMELLKKQRQKDEEEVKSVTEAALHLQREVEVLKKQNEKQKAVTESDKKVIGDLRVQIGAYEEQMEALNQCKATLGQEVDTLMQAHSKMAKDMEESTSKAHTLKEHLSRTEDTKQRLQKTLEGEVKFLQGKLDEKSAENAKLSAEHAKLIEALNKRQGDEGSMFALQMAHDEMKRRLSKAGEQRSALEKEVAELYKRKALWEVKEKDMKREIEDLKERLLMGQEEFKDKYVECKKLQQQLRKAQKISVYSREGSGGVVLATKTTETEPKAESEQTTQTPMAGKEQGATQTAGDEAGAPDLSSEEIQMQLAELGQELENRCAKKLKYKRLYLEEKEKSSYVQRHYHEEMEKKEKELDELRRQLSEVQDQHMLYVRRMEDVESENARQKIQIMSLESMLVEKPSVRQPPRIPPRPSLAGDSAVSAITSGATSGATADAIGKHATLCYGRTDGARDILQKVNTIANERSFQKEDSDTDPKQLSAIPEDGDIHSSLLKEYDPLLDCKETRENKDVEPRCVFEVTSHKRGRDNGSGFDTTVIVSEQQPATESVPVVISRPPTNVKPNTHLSSNAVKPAEGGSTVHLPTTDAEGGRVIRDAPPDVNIERDAPCVAPSPAPRVTDRQATPREQEAEEEKFFDAPVAPSPDTITPSCPVCNLLFPPNTDEAILNAHANTHFNSMLEALPSKKCPMCDQCFSDAHQREYENHVQHHFESGNFV